MTRRVDANWEAVQRSTLEKWLNSALKTGPVKTQREVTNLEEDLRDGEIIAQLLDNLVANSSSSSKGTRVRGINKRAVLEVQKRENLLRCFNFIKNENIKLVNIGPGDIIDGNMKLILGLLWTLIRHYQIRSTGKALSTKQAMLTWINTMVPDQQVSNFKSDWCNGRALCALVDRIQPGLCPHYAVLKPSLALENCELGMHLADEHLGIPRIMNPEDLSNTEVDEVSVMTYISYFCKPAIDRMLEWVQSKLPDRNITNFKHDWNNGTNIACLIEAISPGLYPSCRELDPHDSLQNLTNAMQIAQEALGVKPVIKPSEMADPNVDELNVLTYISRFQYVKLNPQPTKCSVSGPGLTKAFVGRQAQFKVDSTKAGVGELDVSILSSNGSPIATEVTTIRSGIMKVAYVPTVIGSLEISVKWADAQIPGSPFSLTVHDAGAFSLSGPQVTGGKCVVVGNEVVMQAKGIDQVSDLQILIRHENGAVSAAKVSPEGEGEAQCSYTAGRVGKDKLVVMVAGEEVAESPYEVVVIDPTKYSASSLSPPAGQPVSIHKPATFSVTSTDAVIGGIVAEAKSPSQLIELHTSSNKDGSLLVTYTPVEVGNHFVMLTCANDNIRGSPITLGVVDTSKCSFLDTLPASLQLAKKTELHISTRGAGPGKLQASSSNTSVLSTAIVETSPDLYCLTLQSHNLGNADITVTWSGEAIPPSPFNIAVCDASKCSAYGPGLISGTGKSAEPFEFTVQAKDAGKSKVDVKAKGEKSVYAATITPQTDDTFTASFTTYEKGPHSIDVTWGGEPIPGSPFSVNFYKGADAGQFTATGDGLARATAKQRGKFLLLGPEAGLYESGVLNMEISGCNLPMKKVASIEDIGTSDEIQLAVEDKQNGSYTVHYCVPQLGDYSISVSSSDIPINGSPFSLHVLPAAEASACRAFGSAIENPNSLVIGRPLEFKVDTKGAGTGSISVTARDPLGQLVPVFQAEEVNSNNERVYVFKIEPKVQGEYTVDALWSGVHIPRSPLKLSVGDPYKCTITSIPSQEDFIAKVGEPFQVCVDTSKAGPGELQAVASCSNGKKEPFDMKPPSDKGIITASYTPKEPGKVELLLTYSGVSILPSPWVVDAANPGLFQVTPPKGYGRQSEHVKFIISGWKKGTKNMSYSAKHDNHTAKVKVANKDDGTAVGQFTAKVIGKYTVSVKCAGRHIAGSPFVAEIANPNGCRLSGSLPTHLAVGRPVTVTIETSEAGPGSLSHQVEQQGSDPVCLDCDIVEESKGLFKVTLNPKEVGICRLSLLWASYTIPGMPAIISVSNPSKCTFVCPALKDSTTVKQSEEIQININTLLSGPCAPDVIATGPKVSYTPNIVDNKDSTYTATFSPWQSGPHTVDVLVAGLAVPRSPLSFDVVKLIEPHQVTATGPGLHEALSNRPSIITIFAPESGLLKRGALTFEMSGEGMEEQPKFQCSDNSDGSYRLTYTPLKPGNFNLNILFEDKPIAMSPFNVTVKPEPQASKCSVSGRAIEPGVCLLVKQPVELAVNTTRAGTGNLTVTGKQPDGSLLRVFATEEDMDGQKIHYLKFDSMKVGQYVVNINWDSEAVPGSPFIVHTIDPSRCQLVKDTHTGEATRGQVIRAPPSCVQLGDISSFMVDSTGSGTGSFEVLLDDNETSPLLTADIESVEDITDPSVTKFRVIMTGTQIGEAQVSLRCGGHEIPQSPFPVSIYDASKCVVDAEEMLKQTLQVGTSFHFRVTTTGAGKAKLKVCPAQSSSAQYTINIRSEGDENFIDCTPWTVGEQSLEVLWGDTAIPTTPLHFSVCDPKKCQILGLPEPTNFTPIIGEPISFKVDHTQAGPGDLKLVAKLGDGTTEPLDLTNESGVSEVLYSPRMSGYLEFSMEYSGISLLSQPWTCEVPNPAHFKVVTPKGYGRMGEPVRFVITGVTKQTQNFSITAVHPDHTASITTEHAKDEGTFLAFFTPQVMGEYLIQVQHSFRNIDGSPFTIHIANPGACQVTTPPPDTVAVDEEVTVVVDTSAAGPGELTCHIVNLSGELTILPSIAEDIDTDGRHLVSFSSASVGTCQLSFKWADHAISNDVYTINFLDPSQVSYSCKELDEGTLIKQGEPMAIIIDCKEAGLSTPQVSVNGPQSSYHTDVVDNKDGSYTAKVTPWQIGQHTVAIKWGGLPVNGTPFTFDVNKIIDPRTIMAFGDGLRFAIAGEPTIITVNTPDDNLVNQGLLKFSCFNRDRVEEEDGGEEEGPSPDISVSSDGSGSYKLTIVYPTEGSYVLNIDYEDQPIYSSPFSVTVKGAPSADKCRLFGHSLDKMRKGSAMLINHPVEFSVDTTDAGNGSLSVMATDSSGDAVRVFTLDEEANGRMLHHLKFDPYDIGVYTVKLLWSKETIPNTPLLFNVIDPTRCQLTGLPLPNNGTVLLGEDIHFTIAPLSSGTETPVVTLAARTDDAVISTLTPSAVSTGIYQYSSVSHEEGNYNINVTLGGAPVPGSPFKCDIVDPSQFAICGLNITGKYALVCEVVSFKIQGEPPPWERFSVIAHGPLADINCDTQVGDGYHHSSFVPMEPGSYEVFVECAGKHVPGSPFNVMVVDPSKCTILGTPPAILQMGHKEQLIIKTRGAGQGELNVLVNGEKESPVLECSLDNEGLDTFTVNLEPKRVGQVELSIQWCGFNIPQSPLRLSVCDASQCKMFGQVLMSKKGKVGEQLTFTVVTHRAGAGKLTVKATGPSAQYNVNIKEIMENKHEFQFTPWEVGNHTVEVFWGKGQVPKSPFDLSISPMTGTTICTATGDGLKRAIAGKPAVFTIVTSETGLLEKNALKVAVVGVQDKAEVLVKDQNNGCYIVQYVPPLPGAYITTVTYHDNMIPGSPFKINCVPGPDATKCRAYGPALHPNSLHIAGSPLEFKVDSSEAGFGHLRVYIQGPHDHHPKVYIADEGQGLHSVKFDAMKPGRYFIVVAWAESHIPGSPFKVRVHPAADASKVKAYGPGLENGYLGSTGEFTIETKNAGIGTLLIRVHGIKDTFKIEASSEGQDDRRTLVARYSPKTVGDYVVFIRWSGVHIPGSPFTVGIRRSEDEEGDTEEGKPDKSQQPREDWADKQPLLPTESAPQSVSHRKKRSAFKKAVSDDEGERLQQRRRASPGGVVPATFLQRAPVYSGRHSRKTSEQSQVSKSELKKMRSRSRSGPVAPRMKMKTNPSFGGLPHAQGQPMVAYNIPGKGLVMIPASHMYLHGQQLHRKKIVVERRPDKKKMSTSDSSGRLPSDKDRKKSTASKSEDKKKEEKPKEGDNPQASEEQVKKKKKKPRFELV